MCIEGIVPLFDGMADLRLGAWFPIVENLAGNVLLITLLIDGCICKMFPTGPKIVPWHFTPVATISTMTAINSINFDNTVVSVNTRSQDQASRDELNLCFVVHQEEIPAHMQAPVLVSGQAAGIMTIATQSNVLNADVP